MRKPALSGELGEGAPVSKRERIAQISDRLHVPERTPPRNARVDGKRVDS